MCCPQTYDASRNVPQASASGSSNLPKEWQGVSVKNIGETATCRYLIDICVAALCELETFYDNGFFGINEQDTQTTTVGAGSGSGSSSRQQVAANKKTLTADCSFHGLIWDNLVARDSDALRWVAAVKPVTGVSQ